MTPREVIAEWIYAGTDTDNWADLAARDLIAALAAAGYSVVADGQARIDGEVVGLQQPRTGTRFRDESPLYVAVPLTTHDAWHANVGQVAQAAHRADAMTSPIGPGDTPSGSPNVVSLMDALEASVNAAKAARKRSRTIDVEEETRADS